MADIELPPAASRNFAVAMIHEGNALQKQGRIAEAMGRYDAAVQADPQCAPAHLNRGNILLQGAQFDEARSAYQLAIACDPQYVAAHFNLGNLNYRAGDIAVDPSTFGGQCTYLRIMKPFANSCQHTLNCSN